MRNFSLFLVLTGCLFFVLSCQKDNPECKEDFSFNLPEEPFDYSVILPDHVAADPLVDLLLDNEPGNNETTDEGATLGRILFYDKRLSEDNSISCGSCHFQEFSFATDTEFAIGIDGQITNRSSMSLINLRWSNRFFWDLRENSIEDQVLQPIQDHREMNSDLDQLVEELNSILEYKPLFLDAFGSEEITEDRISRALSQFIRSLVSFDSKYDQGKVNDFSSFTESELAGKELFFNGVSRCNNCHTPELMTNTAAMNNGLETESIDLGQYLSTGNESDIGEFKVVTLRNIARTAPYMHDGRFQTLEEVVEFYNTGIQPHQNLNDRITEETTTGGTPITLGLTDEDVSNLVAFLHTLTDTNFLEDEKFSDPFN